MCLMLLITMARQSYWEILRYSNRGMASPSRIRQTTQVRTLFVGAIEDGVGGSYKLQG